MWNDIQGSIDHRSQLIGDKFDTKQLNHKTFRSLNHAGIKLNDPSLQTLTPAATSKIVFDNFKVNVPKKVGPYVGMHNLGTGSHTM